jgi:hypothetical protein
VWIGIDGDSDSSPDLVQAGVECDISPRGLSVYPWFEWLPYDPTEVAIMGLPVSAGDQVYCSISIQHTDTPSVPHNDTVTFFLQNVTQNKLVSVPMSSPADQRVLGSTAEWVVERPLLLGRGLDQLPNYGSVTFTGCLAGSSDWAGEPGLAATNTDTIDMMNDARTATISTGSVPSVTKVTCTYTGP